MKSKIFVFTIGILISFVLISAVSAQENVNTSIDDISPIVKENGVEQTLEIASVDQYEQKEINNASIDLDNVNSNGVISNNPEEKSFDDLQENIGNLKDNATLDLKYDYTYSGWEKSSF